MLVNLRRISTSTEREVSRYADLLRLATWFDVSEPADARALRAAAFGLYSCRHLSFVADPDADPPPATRSWWRAPVAYVPVMLQPCGERKTAGATARREDFAAAKARRIVERERGQHERDEALRELAACRGVHVELELSDGARVALLELSARALSGAGGPLRAPATARSEQVTLVVRRSPGRSTCLRSPSGALELVDLTLELV